MLSQTDLLRNVLATAVAAVAIGRFVAVVAFVVLSRPAIQVEAADFLVEAWESCSIAVIERERGREK